MFGNKQYINRFPFYWWRWMYPADRQMYP